MRISPLRRTARTARSIRAVIARPPYVPPGHFYSPLTAESDLRRVGTWTETPGVSLREDYQTALAGELLPELSKPPRGPRYFPANDMFGLADATVYQAMLRHLRPARVIEIGSGYSTALALDEAAASPGLADLEVSCIEPYPERLLGLMTDADRRRVTLLRLPVQDVPPDFYERLGPSDILFIDSTHVAKAGSDVIWLFLHVLPRLAPGVVVHVHDIFWPFEYPARWLREGRDWTEAYLLHAFLAGNDHWEMLFFSSWIWHCQPELVPPPLANEEPGSIWLRKVR